MTNLGSEERIEVVEHGKRLVGEVRDKATPA